MNIIFFETNFLIIFKIFAIKIKFYLISLIFILNIIINIFFYFEVIYCCEKFSGLKKSTFKSYLYNNHSIK